MKFAALVLLSCFSLSSFSNEPSVHLRDFQSEALFDNHLQEIMSECLAKYGSGSKAVHCFATYEDAWDRELNYYYNLLKSKLNEEDKLLLKTAQLAWIKNRDAAAYFNSALFYAKYPDVRGTFRIAMQSGDASSVITPIIRNRALLMKRWYERLASDK